MAAQLPRVHAGLLGAPAHSWYFSWVQAVARLHAKLERPHLQMSVCMWGTCTHTLERENVQPTLVGFAHKCASVSTCVVVTFWD